MGSIILRATEARKKGTDRHVRAGRRLTCGRAGIQSWEQIHEEEGNKRSSNGHKRVRTYISRTFSSRETLYVIPAQAQGNGTAA